jgi:hypothetical protein
MTGVEAFQALRSWKKIRRTSWKQSEFVEVQDMGNGNGELLRHVEEVTTYHRIYRKASIFADLLRDLLEHDDWEIVE